MICPSAKGGATIWGGGRSIVSISRELRIQLSIFTLSSLKCKWRGRDIASLIGVWSHICHARRPAFSILAAAYGHIKPHELEVRRYPTDAVTQEMILLACVVPLLETNLRVEICPWLGASDAGRKCVSWWILPFSVVTMCLCSDFRLVRRTW